MKKEKKKSLPNLFLLRRRQKLLHERKALKEGFKTIAGVDEAGRGPLAGPVVAAAVILKDTNFKEKIEDSKKLSALQRKRAFPEIISKAEVGIGIVSHRIIDKINIYNATILAMEKAVANLPLKPDILLIDGRVPLKLPLRQRCIINGDGQSCSIAAASIIAKVTRDKIMEGYAKQYPQYGFKEHKGYGTKKHFSTLEKFGPSPIHRFSFAPLNPVRDS